MVLFGGRKGKHYDEDTWKFHFGDSRWEQLAIPGPPKRNHHACGTVAGTFFVFGGRDGRGLADFLGDLWAFDGSRWREHAPVPPWPAPRFLPGLGADPAGEGLLLFGGQGEGTDAYKPRYREIWRFRFNGSMTLLQN
jgi:hypothetical protein